MWEASDWIALGALIVAAFSALVAVVSVGYTWWDRARARPESYRAALYERQLAAAEALVALVKDSHDLLMREPASEAPRRIEKARAAMAEFTVGALFLPPEVIRAGSIWAREAGAVIDAATAGVTPDTGNLRAELEKVWRRFIRRIWSETGAIALHRQVREITGAAGAERSRVDRFKRLRFLDLEVDVMSRGRIPAPSDEELWREIDEDAFR